MDFQDRVLQVIQPYIRDSDWNLEIPPCTLKMMLWELANISYREGHPIHPAVMYVLENRKLPVGTLLSTLRAAPNVLELCSRFVGSPYCSQTIIEIVDRGARELLLRGGVQALVNDPIARLFVSTPEYFNQRWVAS